MNGTEDDTRGLLVRFAMQREKNEHKSLIEGRDIFDEVEVVYIRVPGSKDEITNLVTDDHKKRFSELYRKWRANEAAPITGTPLTEWPAASTSFIDEMRSYGIRTIEQLAELSDGIAMSNPGWLTMRTRAQGFLQAAKDNAAAESLAVQNRQLQEQLAAMQAQIDALTAPPTKTK